jgi:hypothetical protein
MTWKYLKIIFLQFFNINLHIKIKIYFLSWAQKNQKRGFMKEWAKHNNKNNSLVLNPNTTKRIKDKKRWSV